MIEGFYESVYGLEIVKDPDTIKDYAFAWTDRLGTGVTITSVLFTIPSGLTKLSEGINGSAITNDGRVHPIGTVTSVRIQSGTIGTRYTCLCHATFSDGQQDDKSFIIDVRQT